MSDEMDDAAWYRENRARLTAAYLSGGNPRAQSGHSGDQDHWTQARGLIADSVDRDGAFLDIGCANGFLLECLFDWVSAKGYRIEPYGLDFSPELIELARQRLPQWRERLFLGNAIDWNPPRNRATDYMLGIHHCGSFRAPAFPRAESSLSSALD